MLIFGCRSPESDYYYEDEWERIRAQTGSRLTVITAFSRADPAAGKVYVQHKIREHGALLSDLILRQDACVFVSGRAKLMPKAVEKAFTEVIGDALEVQNHDLDKRAVEYVTLMKKSKRYQQEVW